MNHKLIDHVHQIDDEPIEVHHNSEHGEEWLTLDQAGNSVRITLAGLPDLIQHLEKLNDFYMGTQREGRAVKWPVH